jgi:hypothetical protein
MAVKTKIANYGLDTERLWASFVGLVIGFCFVLEDDTAEKFVQ